MSTAVIMMVRALAEEFAPWDVSEVDDAPAANCFFNMHLPGLHSITLIDDDKRRVRVYIATEDIKPGQLAFHAHAYDLCLHVMRGELRHETASFVVDRSPTHKEQERFAAYEHRREKGGTFFYTIDPTITYRAVERRAKIVQQGKEVWLHADDYHTLECAKGTVWLICEQPFEHPPQCLVYVPLGAPKPEAAKPTPMTRQGAYNLLMSLFADPAR